MNVTTTAEEAVLTPSGRFDAHECTRFREVVEALMDDTSLIAVDLSSVEFIDSAGLAELVRVMRRAREAGGDVRLVRPSRAVRIILELTRLDAAFEIEWADGDAPVG